MATEHDSWLEGIGVDVAGFLDSAAQQVEVTASSVAETVTSTASAVAGAVGSAVGSAEQTGSPMVAEVADAASGVGQEASTAFQSLQDAGSSAFGAVADFTSDAVKEVEAVATTAADEAAGAVDAVVDGVKSMAQEVADTASDFYEDVRKALEGLDLPYQFGGVQAPLEKAMEEANPVTARGLTSGEMADAKLIFGDSLDYSKVIVDGGSVASLGACRTIGNTVHLTSDLFQPNSSETTTKGKRTLVHELTHVWQYQHQGWTYAPKALWAQAKAAVSGSRNGAYDWKPLVKNGTPWEEWNPEAQAEAVEEYNIALHKVNDGTATREDYDALEILAKYVRNVGPAPAPSDSPRDPVFSCALDVHGEVNLESDGSWSYSWSWTYGGTTLITSSDVHEEFLVMDDSGQILEVIKEAGHGVHPGKTYLGSGNGKRKIRADKIRWKLMIPYKDGYVGVRTGSVSVMVAA
jgi:hypothetical protein